MRLPVSKLLPAVLLLAVTGCELITGLDDTVVELAHLPSPESRVLVAVEDEDLSIEILTLGMNSCVSYHSTDVDIDRDEHLITIRPYNERVTDQTCGQAVVEIPHEITLFNIEDGDWIVRVIGRVPGSGSDEVTVEVPVQVAVPIIVDNPNG